MYPGNISKHNKHVVLLYISPGPCQDENDRTCDYNSAFDIDNTQCVSTRLNCVNSNICRARINNFRRPCRFMNIGADALPLPIHCCLCYTSLTGPYQGDLLWDCTPSPSLPSSSEQHTIAHYALHEIHHRALLITSSS